LCCESGSHETDGEPTYIDNDSDDCEETSGEVAVDMTSVESVCKEMGFVLSANSGSRSVNMLLSTIMFLVNVYLLTLYSVCLMSIVCLHVVEHSCIFLLFK